MPHRNSSLPYRISSLPHRNSSLPHRNNRCLHTNISCPNRNSSSPKRNSSCQHRSCNCLHRNNNFPHCNSSCPQRNISCPHKNCICQHDGLPAQVLYTSCPQRKTVAHKDVEALCIAAAQLTTQKWQLATNAQQLSTQAEQRRVNGAGEVGRETGGALPARVTTPLPPTGSVFSRPFFSLINYYHLTLLDEGKICNDPQYAGNLCEMLTLLRHIGMLKICKNLVSFIYCVFVQHFNSFILTTLVRLYIEYRSLSLR